MEKDSGKWIMYGVDWDDPECIHTVDEAIEYINEIGFLPLFRNDIPGFSLEERTVPEYWWCEDVDRDPWMWRAVIAFSPLTRRPCPLTTRSFPLLPAPLTASLLWLRH